MQELDPRPTIYGLIRNLKGLIEAKSIPGLIIGISGSDSVLAFLLCYKAMNLLGIGKRVIGVHFQTPQTKWFTEEIIPWLTEQCAQAIFRIDESVPAINDGMRWGKLLDMSIVDNSMACTLPTGSNYWVVSSVNLTERTLKTYSNGSRVASIQPLDNLFKSEVLLLCEELGVPDVLLRKSRQADVICGRCQLMAHNIDEIDDILRVRGGWAPTSIYTPEQIEVCAQFVDAQIKAGTYKEQIPYRFFRGSYTVYLNE